MFIVFKIITNNNYCQQAGPLFYDDESEKVNKKRLSKSDAHKVIALHTNAGGFGTINVQKRKKNQQNFE